VTPRPDRRNHREPAHHTASAPSTSPRHPADRDDIAAIPISAGPRHRAKLAGSARQKWPQPLAPKCAAALRVQLNWRLVPDIVVITSDATSADDQHYRHDFEKAEPGLRSCSTFDIYCAAFAAIGLQDTIS
jgi:hypothetical protein